MPFLFLIGAIVIIAISALAIAWPLLRESAELVAQPTDPDTLADPMMELEQERDSLYQAIRELRFDYEVGKVSEADYLIFENQLKGRAVVVLQEIDTLHEAEIDPDLDARIEGEIAALRRNGTGKTAGDPLPVPVGQKGYCSQCGETVRAGDGFCGQCGARVA
ncbi:MAG: zinc ribbon domain-containing protein [Chloroflexota bacterium]|nr:zinc ribbon domain-containing protein [Chloroflexota bacterium]